MTLFGGQRDSKAWTLPAWTPFGNRGRVAGTGFAHRAMLVFASTATLGACVEGWSRAPARNAAGSEQRTQATDAMTPNDIRASVRRARKVISCAF